MSRLAGCFATFVLLLPGFCMAQPTNASPMQLACNIGPITKVISNAKWLIYSCSDGRSIVFVSAPENPASPFYFMFQATSTGHQLIGEGTGSKVASNEAYSQLRLLSEPDIQSLIKQTKAENYDKGTTGS